MSAIRFVDNGVVCNHDDCNDMRYASQLSLSGEATAADVRATLCAKEGWASRRVLLDAGRRRYKIEGFCPAHADDAGNTAS